jgi:hypothetical protein
LSPFHIKGNPYRGLVHFVEKHLPGGLDALSRALDDDALRAFIRQPFLASGRYDVLPIVPLTEAVAGILGTPVHAFIRVATCGQAQYDAKTVFKLIYDGATVESLVDRIPRFGAQYYDFGEFSGRILGPKKLVLQHARIPAYLHRWYGPMHEAYTEESGRIVGAKNARATAMPPIPAGVSGAFELVTASSEMTW